GRALRPAAAAHPRAGLGQRRRAAHRQGPEAARIHLPQAHPDEERMKPILLIARRELAAYLRSWTGFVIIAAVLAIDGLLFNAYALGGPDKRSSEVLSLFFYFSSGTTMIASIFISMRLVAEERQTGTLALLYSSPVRDGEIIVGKFLSALAFLSI